MGLAYQMLMEIFFKNKEKKPLKYQTVISNLLWQEISLNLTFNKPLVQETMKSQQQGYTLLAWQVVVQFQPKERILIYCVFKGFFLTYMFSDYKPPPRFLKCEFLHFSFLPLFCLLFTYSLCSFFPLKHHSHFSRLTTASSPSVLSDLIPVSLRQIVGSRLPRL